MRYHAKETLGSNGFQWEFEKRETTLQSTNMLLVRVMIGKIQNRQQLDSTLSSVPVKAGTPGWNCVSWVKEALEELEQDGKSLGTRVTEWKRVRDAAMGYCGKKKEQGRFTREKYNPETVPTYDLIENKEIDA